MVSLTVLFFVWTVVQSRVDQFHMRKAWGNEYSVPNFHDFKSSVLMLLYHGFERDSLEVERVYGQSNRMKELEDRAKEVKVRLVATESGWMLSTKED
jgi:hypothetical protein